MLPRQLGRLANFWSDPEIGSNLAAVFQAYANYEDFMDLTEDMMRRLVQEVSESTTINYQGEIIDLEQPFVRISVADSIIKYNPG